MNIFKNITYDIKAIRKYGLNTHIKYLLDYKLVIINLQTHLDYIPPFRERPEYEIKEVDINNNEIIKQWVKIVNDAFGFEIPFNVDTAKDYLNNHLYKTCETVFFLYEPGNSKPIGTYFIGRFSKNGKIGTTGRLAVKKEYQNRGLGGYLVLYGLNRLRDKGYKQAEHVFVASKPFSYYHYFKCGSYPQFNKKYLQLKPTRKFFLVRLMAQYKVKKMYNNFLKKRNEAFLMKG